MYNDDPDDDLLDFAHTTCPDAAALRTGKDPDQTSDLWLTWDPFPPTVDGT